MHLEVDHQNGNGLLLLAFMWMLNIITLIDRGLITFILGTIVTILAGWYYILQIRKLRRENKNKAL